MLWPRRRDAGPIHVPGSQMPSDATLYQENAETPFSLELLTGRHSDPEPTLYEPDIREKAQPSMSIDARTSPLLGTIRGRIARMGAHFNPAILRETRELYQPFLPKASERLRVLQDVPFAPDDRQRVDVYAPAEASGLPVLVYVPGGGFVGGDKRDEFGFYSNIGHSFAERGFLVLVINYRLAPKHCWPAGGEDVGHAIAWAGQHAAAHGGNPERIAVFGQSAGATHVLTWLFDPVLEGAKPVSAVVLASGTYRIGGEKIPSNVTAYFGADPSQYEARSPMSHVHRTGIPFLLTVSEFDPPFLASPTFELAAKLTDANGSAPRFLWFAGHNHVSNVFSIGTPDDEAARLVTDFLNSP
jgi:acetyl esterase/lipase